MNFYIRMAFRTAIFCLTLSLGVMKPEPISVGWPTYVPSVKLPKKAIPVTYAKKRKQKVPPLPVDSLTTKEILNDIENRVSPHFKVSEDLFLRTSFWFDIYTKYDQYHKVIHHRTYPWLVFDVVDVRKIMHSNRPYLERKRHARFLVEKRRKQVQDALWTAAMSPTDYREQFTELEKKVFEITKKTGLPHQKILSSAYDLVRVQTGQKVQFIKGVERASAYMPAMEGIFHEYGLPTDLIRIPLVESSFNWKAVSKVGASGVWQIMPKVGKKFLIMTDHIDERNSPLKSTRVAAKLLKSKLQILKSWPLAVTAYNHGPGGLLRASRKLKTKNLAEIIDKHKDRRFGFASSNFYAEFLAALHAEKYKDVLFENVDELEPIDFEQYRIEVEPSLSVEELALYTNSTPQDLLKLNYDLKRAVRKNVDLPDGYVVFLNRGKSFLLEQNLASRKSQEVARSGAEQRSQFQNPL